MRVQADHWDAFLTFAEVNPSIITNKFSGGPNGKNDLDSLWSRIVISLNAVGLGEKSKVEWKKQLLTGSPKLKQKQLIKAADIAKHIQKTEGVPKTDKVLSSFEQRLFNLMKGKLCQPTDLPLPIKK